MTTDFGNVDSVNKPMRSEPENEISRVNPRSRNTADSKPRAKEKPLASRWRASPLGARQSAPQQPRLGAFDADEYFPNALFTSSYFHRRRFLPLGGFGRNPGRATEMWPDQLHPSLYFFAREEPQWSEKLAIQNGGQVVGDPLAVIAGVYDGDVTFRRLDSTLCLTWGRNKNS